jgi:hypothetical protein
MSKTQLLLILLIATSIFLVVCTPSTDTTEQELIDRFVHQVDDFQVIIYDLVSESYTFRGQSFITYIVMGRDDDDFYERYYLHAMIDDIDINLNVIHSFVYPFAFTFDRDSGELIRYYFPRESDFSMYDIRSNFPQHIMAEFVTLPQDEYISRIEKLSSTNMWSAMLYYGYE